MRGMRWLALAGCALGSTACLHDTLVSCGDVLCPTGFTCDHALSMCVDPNGLSVPDGPITFDALGCGMSSPVTLPLKNFSLLPISFTAFSTVAGITPSPASGAIDAGGSIDLTVVAQAPSESIPGVATEGTLVIQTDRELIGRPLSMTTTGALVTASATNLDFGESGLPGNTQRAITITNSGTVATDLTLGTLAAPYALPAVSGSMHFDPGVSNPVAIAFDPLVIGSFSSSVGLSFSGTQCQAPPASIALTGSATADPILLDYLVLDFGTSACGVPASVLPLGLTSNLGAAQTLTSTILGSASAMFSTTTTTTLPRGPMGMLSLPVTRQALQTTTTVGAKSATLNVSAQNSGVIKNVTLLQNVVAPVLSVDNNLFCFGSVFKHTVAQATATLTNSGNTVGNVTISPPSFAFSGGTTLTISPTSLQIQPLTSAPITITVFAGTTNLNIVDALFTIQAVGACSDPIVLDVSFSTCASSPCPQ